MPTVTLKQVNENILELKRRLTELENQTHKLQKTLNTEEKGWNLVAEENLRKVWDNKKDDKVWQKYL